MGILNKDVCKIETNYSIKDTKTDTWGDGATEEEAWKDLEGHLYDHFWLLAEHSWKLKQTKERIKAVEEEAEHTDMEE